MKTCPFCGAEIHEQAVLCVHCNAMLNKAPVVNTASDANICPNCGNECIKEAVICVKCGQMLEKKKAAATKAPKRNTEKTGFIYIVACVLFGIDLLDLIVSTFRYSMYDFSWLMTVALSLLLFIGIVIKKDKFIGCVYIATLVEYVIFSFDYITTTWNSVFYIFAILILGLLFLVKNEKIKKLWFIPGILYFLFRVIFFAQDMIEYGFEDYFYLYDSFIDDYFMPVIWIAQMFIAGMLVKSNICSKKTEVTAVTAQYNEL